MRTSLLLLLLGIPALALAQPAPELYASGFHWASDVQADARGWLWVAEGGTGAAGTGRVSVVTPDGTRHDFLTGLPSMNLPVIAYGARGLRFLDGQLVVVMGAGADPLSATLVAIDTTGFAPGDPPRTPADLTVLADVGDFAASEGFPASNPAHLAVGPDGAWYVTDSGANALFRYDPTAMTFSTVATFEPIPNPTPIGPPMIPALPIGVMASGDHLLVACQRGFPYLEGVSTVYAVWPDGATSVVRDHLDNNAEVIPHRADGTPVVAPMGGFEDGIGFLPGESEALRLDGTPTRLADDLSAAVALAFGPDGSLFAVEQYPDGDLYRIPPAVLGAEPFAVGLFGSVGLAVDGEGRLWGAQPGTGADDSRIAVLDDGGQWQSFAVGLPSSAGMEGPEGANHLLFDGADLWVAVGTGSANPRGFLYRFDASGFTPGDPPRTPADATLTVDVGAFVLGEGFPETNVYGLAMGLDGSIYMTDASANAVLRRAPDGTLSVLAELAPIPNPTPVPPPFAQAVPTGIVFQDDRLYVGALSGFPFVPGISRVYEVSLDGDVSVFRDGLTSTVDLAMDPRDGALTALQFGRFSFDPPPPNFLPTTGLVRRLDDDRALALNLSFSSALAYAADGTLYVGSLGGDVYRITSSPVANEPGPRGTLPEGFALLPAYPNPFNPSAQVPFELSAEAAVRLTVYDALGREVAVLAAGRYPAGRHTVAFDAAGLPSGLYLVRLTDGRLSQTRRVTLVR